MSTGNAERDKLLADAIKQCALFHDAPTLENVREKLPHDFDLLPDEYADAMAELAPADPAPHGDAHLAPMIKETPDGHPLAAPKQSVAEEAPANALRSRQGEALPQAPLRDAPVISQAQARAAVESAHKRLGEGRVRVKIAQQRLMDTKARLALCIEAWRHNEDPLTPEQRQAREHRAYLASEQERKQHLADCGVRPNKMRTDKFPAVLNGVGGYKGGSRGAMSETQRARYGFTIPGSPAAQARTIMRDKIRGEK
jgi:hypothetical protein